jgi:hypothetical protein
MNTNALISSLVATYRELNINLRPLGENAKAHEIVTRMRDDEIQFSKALKDRLTGIGTATDDESTDGATIIDGADDTLAQVISQFGTARATTLNLLKGIQDSAVWSSPLDDGSTIVQRVDELARSDARQLQRLGISTS